MRSDERRGRDPGWAQDAFSYSARRGGQDWRRELKPGWVGRWIGKELKTRWGKGRGIYKVGAPRAYGLFKTVWLLPPKESSLSAFVKERRW